MNRSAVLVMSGAATGCLATALVMLVLRDAPAAAIKDAIAINQAKSWSYHKDGIRISYLAISPDNKNLPVTAPGVSAKFRNDTADRMIVALHVVLLDASGKLVAAECLSNPPSGLIGPGEEKTVAVMLQVPSKDIARVKNVRLRVTRAAVHSIGRGGTI